MSHDHGRFSPVITYRWLMRLPPQWKPFLLPAVNPEKVITKTSNQTQELTFVVLKLDKPWELIDLGHFTAENSVLGVDTALWCFGQFSFLQSCCRRSRSYTIGHRVWTANPRLDVGLALRPSKKISDTRRNRLLLEQPDDALTGFDRLAEPCGQIGCFTWLIVGL